MAKQVSLSHKAESVLEDIIQNGTKGEAIYFWTRLDTGLGLPESKSLISFWSTCDVLNGGYCRFEFESYSTLFLQISTIHLTIYMPLSVYHLGCL